MEKNTIKYTVFFMILPVLMTGLLTASAEESHEIWEKAYFKAGTIKMYDPKMALFGTAAPETAIMHFNLIDVAKLCGHLCGGTVSGFMMTKTALKALYQKDELPLRGDIRLTSNMDEDPIQVAAYITGASPRDHHGHKTLIIDRTLKVKKGGILLIFERISNGKKIQITWNKMQTLKNHVGDIAAFKKIKMKAIHKKDDKAASRQFRKLINTLVLKIIDNKVTYTSEILPAAKVKRVKSDTCRSCH